jgi:hypothetical protein
VVEVDIDSGGLSATSQPLQPSEVLQLHRRCHSSPAANDFVIIYIHHNSGLLWHGRRRYLGKTRRTMIHRTSPKMYNVPFWFSMQAFCMVSSMCFFQAANTPCVQRPNLTTMVFRLDLISVRLGYRDYLVFIGDSSLFNAFEFIRSKSHRCRDLEAFLDLFLHTQMFSQFIEDDKGDCMLHVGLIFPWQFATNKRIPSELHQQCASMQFGVASFGSSSFRCR